MCEAQVIVVFLASQFREARDQAFRPYGLPYHEALAFYPKSRFLTDSYRPGTYEGLIELFIMNFAEGAHGSEAYLDRRLASLRVVGAIRIHAANHGKLPDSLAEITHVSVPIDPVTGRSFECRRDEDALILSAPKILIKGQGLPYTVTIRR